MPDGQVLKQGNNTASSSAGYPIVEDFGTLSGTALINAFSNSTADANNAFIANSSAHCPVTTLDSDYFPTAINGATSTNPGGDKPWTTQKNTSTSFAITFGDIFGIPNPGSSILTRPASGTSQQQFDQNVQRRNAQNAALTYPTWNGTADSERDLYGSTFQGFTYGPGYWGKSFFIWPPQPDWTPNPANPASTTYTNTTNGPGGGPIKNWLQSFYW